MKNYLRPTVFVVDMQEEQVVATSGSLCKSVVTEEWGESSALRTQLWGEDSEDK